MGNEATARLADDIQKLVFPGGLNKESSSCGNKLNDIDHLVGHKINGRDIFVTDDQGILRKSEELKKSPGIVVMEPAQCLKFLQNLAERNKKVPLFSDRMAVGYASKNLSGRVTFNFTNNNGSFVIGDGLFLFETMWSEAGADSIYTLSDRPNIDSLALAKGKREISAVCGVENYDFSSRVRSPKEGKVVVVKNTNGYFAAIKILDVLVEDRGDARDELTFEYVIQVDGSADFSR